MKLLQKVPMRRQDRQDVKRWLAELHPYVNQHHRLREGGWCCRIQGYNGFPTNEATIRRFFAWCQRHNCKPDRLSRCLYWGLCEPAEGSGYSSGPIFRGFNPANIEHLVDRPTRWLTQHDENPAESINIYNDAYRMVIQVINEKHQRVFKTQMDVRIASSEMFGYDDDPNKRYSVSNNVTISFKPKLAFGYQFQAETVLRPKASGATFSDAINSIVASQVDVSKLDRNFTVELQPYAYRNGKRIKRSGRW